MEELIMDEQDKSEIRDFGIFRNASLVNIEPIQDARISRLDEALETERRSIATLATSDINEITARQEVARWIASGSAKKFISKLKSSREKIETFPNLGHRFIEYYNLLEKDTDKTAFWSKVRALREYKNDNGSLKHKIPLRIEEILNEIQKNSEMYFSKERDIAKKIVDDLHKVITAEGILKFEIDIRDLARGREQVIKNREIQQILCFGTKQFSSKAGQSPKPPMAWKAWKHTGAAGKKLEKQINQIKTSKWLDQKEKWLQSFRFNSAPNSIINDIKSWLNKTLLGAKDLIDEAMIESLSVSVAYQLNAKGLNLEIIDWKTKTKTSDDQSYKISNIDHPDFGEAKDASLVTKFGNTIIAYRDSMACVRNQAELTAWMLDLSQKIITIEAPETFKEFCIPHLSDIHERYSEEMTGIKQWQNNINKTFNDILFLDGIIETLQEKELPICFPDLSDGENYLQINGISPIRLAGKKIHPFGEIFLNGAIVNLTGRNNSGKTTMEEALLDAFLMAQSGLPIAAKEAKMTIKKSILLSFLERISGESTFKAKLGKDAEIIRAIKKMEKSDQEKTLVIIDELGSATTQGSVIELVQKYLDWLNKCNASVILSTQIPEIGHYIGEKLGGTNLIITPDYQLISGIGEGEPEKLARDMGLMELLEEN